MEIYVGAPGTLRHWDFIQEHGLRTMHNVKSWRYPKKDIHYAVDNGAFHSYANGKPFDAESFIKNIKKADAQPLGPDFVVCPDIVAAGRSSLEFSIEWSEKMPRDDYYLAVQDNMEEIEVLKNLNGFEGIFVGGTRKWKYETAEQWVKLAHENNIKCHIGRIGTFKKMLWARRIGADSIDSSTFVQGPPDMRAFKRIIAMFHQTCFDGPCTGDKGCVCDGCAMPHLDASPDSQTGKVGKPEAVKLAEGEALRGGVVDAVAVSGEVKAGASLGVD